MDFKFEFTQSVIKALIQSEAVWYLHSIKIELKFQFQKKHIKSATNHFILRALQKRKTFII